jgi:hypothetical protein
MHPSRHCIWCILLVLATYLTVLLTRRVLFLVTLILVVREIYLGHGGNIVRGPTTTDDRVKDGDIGIDNMETGRAPPMSDPNL